MSVEDGASVFTRTFGLGSAGLIDINATESIDVFGVSAVNPSQFSAIGSTTLSPGNSGNVKISAKNISVLNAGVIATTTFSNGSAGDVTIDSENTQVAGKSMGIFRTTAITSTSFGKGDAGRLGINTQTLSVRDGASVNTTSHDSGNAGNVTVNAAKSVEVIDGDKLQAANINSSVFRERTVIGQLLGLPEVPAGDAGNVTVNTPYLKVSNYGAITVRNVGTGVAGTLKVNADLVQLDSTGEFAASSNSGGGGNIFVQADSLQLRRNSLIATNAVGKGNGGNIIINSNTLVGLENSDIIANAVAGNGGNISITTQGIFGLEFRDKLTEESDITASSEFGVNGTVDIKNFGIDPSSGLVELSVDLADESQKIASGCAAQTGSRFSVTGRGGIPQNPSQSLYLNSTWSDIRDLSAYQKRNNIQATQISNKPAIVEATGFVHNANGEIELVASENIPFTTKQVSNCDGLST